MSFRGEYAFVFKEDDKQNIDTIVDLSYLSTGIRTSDSIYSNVFIQFLSQRHK